MIGAAATARAVRGGTVSAVSVAEAAIERAEVAQASINAFTNITRERARRTAEAIDRRVAGGESVGPLAGVPFAVKDLFDLEGERTPAGSKVLLDRGPAAADAAAVARLVNAGAVPIGAATMDEFAFGFTTENSHFGPARNPHDTSRTAGGSSGGSAAAVGGGVVPLSLGTDTNGSVRVPASLCGVFGLKPTYGSIDRSGVQLFSDSLDHIGGFARSAEDLELLWNAVADDATRGAPLPAELRVGVLTGWFRDNADDTAVAAVEAVIEAICADGGAWGEVDLERAEAAHAAASVVTYAEAGELHLDRIRTERKRFDPVVRHRLVAGALLPADWYVRAQRLRSVWRAEVSALFERFDILVAPATPFSAPRLGTETITVNGRELPARPAVGWLTQPLTPTGLPIGVAPVWSGRPLPIGVQVVAPDHCEHRIIDVLRRLESAGVADSPVGSQRGAPA